MDAGGVERARAYQQGLLRGAVHTLCSSWGTAPLVEPGSGAGDSNMALVRLPAAAAAAAGGGGGSGYAAPALSSKEVQDALHYRHGVECPIKTVNGELYARISAGVYNEAVDYERLAAAVRETLGLKG
jgi:isopenicillin-N epimerase